MADNYLEKKMEQHRAVTGVQTGKSRNSLATLLERNRSTRGYDNSFIVRPDQLRRIVAVNTKVASARNRQVLRFRLVTADEVHKVLPYISMGAAITDVRLPLPGTEPNAFIVICSSIPPRTSTYIDLGISVQSMLLQAVEIGLNGLCILSFDKQGIMDALGLGLEPLMLVAIGKSAEKIQLVDIKEADDHSYYREDDVHYVPKVVVEDLIIE
ncbi:MAG: nitroreductase family protein [Bacteroidaceae bacterium]|nr:nitroreductase family protein [Bacteroidaceae bacterium]